ncbi:Bug family tripartite tricarboxylate transporter substrate binding protein [Ramlibacter sp.]|uniref:Bug family tripartite tricarboxylate transporter substrate binding protein n=1 Tax=Ramlibacter sp. TaxID=1917967 RepID=UPI003D0DD1D5
MSSRTSTFMPLRRVTLTLAMSAILLPTSIAHAQVARPAGAEGFPSRPIRLIMPVAPGSGSEAASRFLAEKMSALLQSPVVPENRPGGETKVGLQALISAPADGHAVMLISSSVMVINPLTIEGWDIDVRKRVRPLALATRVPAALVVSANSRWRTLAEFLAAAKAKPGSISVANYSGAYRLGLNRMARSAGAEFNLVSYKGAGQALTDLIGGSVDSAFTDLLGPLSLVDAGKLRVLAVTSPERSAAMPQVPTVREAMPSMRDFEFGIWLGYGVRAETPEPIVKVLESAMLTVLRSPEYQAFNRTNSNPELIAADGAFLSKQIDAETELMKATLPTR